MPIPLGPAIAAGGSLLSQGINAASTASMNKKTRKWNEKMYGIQRANALADWNMQNEYDSPQAQMARLREAGLNPALVYDNGAHMSSPSSVSNTSPASWNPKAPQFDIGAGIGAYQDVQVRQAQVDNLRTQNTVLEQEAALKAAQIVGTLASTASTLQSTEAGRFDLGMKQTLADNTIAMAEAQLRKVTIDANSTLHADERAAALQESNLQAAAESVLNLRLSRAKTNADIAHIRQQIENLKKDSQLKQLDINLKEKGIQPGDPLWIRALSQFFDGMKMPDANLFRRAPVGSAAGGAAGKVGNFLKR